ncbi:PREDICTED: uncharacterized protein LOC104720776 [Camelina sativa]|uniref:Uncharacterized protein LOC104720776 n=1 Tax=Camelina sativa TaxID=90675 RepID=A0ABM0U738_CAMSA|nr:PREDICTED: uncharacterized protein LOC104720776 [Camelina sativa]
MFKSPSEKSEEALNSYVVKIKEHQLVKDKALRISSHLDLDEIQSYILVERSMDQDYGTTDSVAQEFIDVKFTMQLLEGRLENDVVFGLVVFSLQYILASHEYWKYNHGNMRWKVTLKVLELMKTCLRFSKLSTKLRDVLLDILLHDASVHGALFRIVCTTTQTSENLCSSRFVEPAEIEGWQLAIVSVLDVLNATLSQFFELLQLFLYGLHPNS